MKKVLCLLIVISITAFTACLPFGPGLADYSYNVADGYMVFRSSVHMIQVVPKSGWHSDGDIIPEKVVEIAWNDRYVIAKQVGLKEAYPNDPNNSYMIPNESEMYFWILDASERTRYGPYSEDEFEEKLIEFNLADLVLRDVDAEAY